MKNNQNNQSQITQLAKGIIWERYNQYSSVITTKNLKEYVGENNVNQVLYDSGYSEITQMVYNNLYHESAILNRANDRLRFRMIGHQPGTVMYQKLIGKFNENNIRIAEIRTEIAEMNLNLK